MGYRRTSTATVTPRELARLHKGKDVLFALTKRSNTERLSKYGNRRVEVDGIWFDSAAEAKRWGELLLLQRAGQITELTLQEEFRFEVNGRPVFKYLADFAYMDMVPPVPVWVVEDVKGVRTAVYKLKKRLIEAQYGITITEIPA